MSEAQKQAMAWEADAIEKCRADPTVARLEAEGALCVPCLMPHPCLCDKNATLSEMREYYEANRRTLTRSEPMLIMSWGVKGDGLMTGLYKIATKAHELEIGRLRGIISRLESK